MERRLPPGYYVERDPDICTLRQPDGHSVAAFSAGGGVAETIEGAAWKDHRGWPTTAGARSTARGGTAPANDLAALAPSPDERRHARTRLTPLPVDPLATV